LSTAYIVYSDRHHPDLPSFPTRRSSDLRPKGAASVRTGSLIYPLAGLLCCHNRYQLHQRSSEQRVAILPPSAGSELQKAGPLLHSQQSDGTDRVMSGAPGRYPGLLALIAINPSRSAHAQVPAFCRYHPRRRWIVLCSPMRLSILSIALGDRRTNGRPADYFGRSPSPSASRWRDSSPELTFLTRTIGV